MLFHIADLCILTNMEGVYAVVNAVSASAVGYAAAGDDRHIAVLAYVEIIIYKVL